MLHELPREVPLSAVSKQGSLLRSLDQPALGSREGPLWWHLQVISL
jgi:hypothetical protein